MDWALVGRSLLRYTLGYAGLVVLVAALVTRSELGMLVVVGTGFTFLLIAAGGIGSVRAGSAAATAESAMFRSGATESRDYAAKALAVDLKLVFVGVGLILFGFLGMIALGEVPA